MAIGHKAGHYCHFRVLRNANSDTGRKKKKREREREFRIYWEGDDTFILKVPRVGDRTAPGGSSFQSLTVRGKKVLLL